MSHLPPLQQGLYPPSAESQRKLLGMRLCVLHNLYFYNTMMEEIRQALDEGRYEEYKKTETGRHGRRTERLKKHAVNG